MNARDKHLTIALGWAGIAFAVLSMPVEHHGQLRPLLTKFLPGN